MAAFTSLETKNTSQAGKGDIPIPGRPTTYAEGMVEELTLVTPGIGYPPNRITQNNITTTAQNEINITDQLGEDIATD